MIESLQPYQPIRKIAEDLYCVDGEWYETAFRRRMTIVRLKDGSLVVHSAIRMEAKDYTELEKLGKVSIIIIPNVFHYSDAKAYSERYPDAQVYVPAQMKIKCEKHLRVAGVLEKDWPLGDELPCISFLDTLAGESVFIHKASGTLIVTDMTFNLTSADFKSGIERFIFGKLNGILDQFGPSQLTKLVAARNRDSVGAALKKITAQDFDRVIMSHGQIVETEGKKKFLAGYQRVYGVL
ncbi:MAG: DUF4336 domain-containing protein [Bdellovibrionia bacterium]